MSRVKAITFDLWDTLVHDDSDEPKRASLGLRSKRDERRHLLWDSLNALDPIDHDSVRLACDVADAGFNVTWKEASITWQLEQRLRVALTGLDRTLPDAGFQALVDRIGTMEVEIPPDPIDGVAEALAALSRRYPLAIVSDAIVTPGTGLRRLLEKHGLKDYFQAFAFSDEVGRSKPHRSMFEAAAGELGVDVEDTIHVGDRDHNDVKGPQALGARAILFTATRDVDRKTTSADAVCNHHHELPALVERLAEA